MTAVEVGRRVSRICEARGGFFPADAGEGEVRDFLSQATGLDAASPLWLLSERFELGFGSCRPGRDDLRRPRGNW
jgi:hypothetical protein